MHAGEHAGDWWECLPVLCVPVRQLHDGGFGFLSADLTPEAEPGAAAAQPRRAIVAFEDRGDAQQVQWLWDAWEAGGGAGEDGGHNRHGPMFDSVLPYLSCHVCS